MPVDIIMASTFPGLPFEELVSDEWEFGRYDALGDSGSMLLFIFFQQEALPGLLKATTVTYSRRASVGTPLEQVYNIHASKPL